ncbi:uncharacterized protein SPSK_01477 [Sporothrix schenckii 1099-18]|uniref:xylan 1,4-beta-xylosidase n=2 Tax=Sporothrix schenckii TaxID=29908 RepID=U7PLP9_SPOS1|nr:uncharacterized protein SPSK_01477 [Sporothrix schenckii 1099-18]ERS96482.1 hypothetical protein HMPREF1624_07397 [Sporothrix schenckii ATCC 58251]KJR87222.1 hypothetical protein SPSK_01477 [Sporothrix schenckii 1099-18]
MPSLTALLLAGVASPAAALYTFPDCTNGPLSNNTVCNPKAAPAARAAALVKAMTVDEKLDNLLDASPGAPRIGLPAYEWWSEALHGVAGSPGVKFNIGTNSSDFSHATSFAGPITLSAAFDDDLVERVATVVSTEARAFGNAGRSGLDFWTPNINPYKDPRWGRGSETPGEDPFRIKGYVRALLRGLEGPYVGGGNGSANAHPSGPGNHGHGGNSTRSNIRKIIATCKHYAAYDLERWNGTERYGFDAIVSLQDLSEYYLPAFQQCARDSRVGSIMCSYNAVNGTPACANTYLMTDILREHWGWTEDNNYVTSDCNAVRDFDHQHAYDKNGAEAAAAAYGAGTDTVCETWSATGTDARGAYNQSLLSEAVLDRALSRLYEGLVRVGYFDPADASPYRALGWKDVDTPAARALAHQSAADGLVLKKNDGLLPLAVDTNKTVALIGHWADQTHTMLGGYSGIPPFYHSPADAAAARNWSTVVFGRANGAPISDLWHGAPDSWTRPALAAAAKADIVLYFGGTDQSIAAEEKDRVDITLPGVQLNLVNALAALGKPLVVVQLGDQTDDTPLLTNSNVSAVVWAGYPGQDGGNAVLDVLTGVKAPAGRLPVTQYPANYTDAVPMTDMRLRPAADAGTPHSSNPGRTYRWYDKAVLAFGHGLHYTTFAAKLTTLTPSAARARNATIPRPIAGNGTSTFSIADVVARCAQQGGKAAVRHKDLCHFANVAASVTNTGNTTSDFVALAFLAGEYGPAPFPRKTLAAYRRLRNVAPGKTTTTALSLSLGNLARTDAAGNLVLYPGKYTLLLDEPTQSTLAFELTGDAVTLDEFPQPK